MEGKGTRRISASSAAMNKTVTDAANTTSVATPLRRFRCTMRPHGARESQPEAGFYFVGMIGRASTFLMRTWYEQVRCIAADIAGDRKAVERVELVLPETSVCGRPAVLSASQCCGGPAPSHVRLLRRRCKSQAARKDRLQMAVNASRSDGVRISGCKENPSSLRCARGKWIACCRRSS